MTAACLQATGLLQALQQAEAASIGEPLDVVREIDATLPDLHRQHGVYIQSDMIDAANELATALTALENARRPYP